MIMAEFWGVASALAKLAQYIGISGSLGLVMIRVAFFDAVRPIVPRMRRQTVVLAGIALFAALFGFLLRGAALTGDVGGMADREMLGLLWGTPVGTALVFRVAGVAMIIAGRAVQRSGHWLALAGGALALWSFAQIGHVPELEQPGVRFLLFVHLLGISFWIGVLAPLRHLSRHQELFANAAVLGHAFGQAAAVIVPLLILAGLTMAWLILGDLQALFMSGYGQALLAKLVLVGAILILAAANKLRFVPALHRGDTAAARHLARSVEFEAFLMLLVLAATAILTSLLTLPS